MCLLPVEPGIINGEFHRDIFVKSNDDFTNMPFYITHIIYLDNISSTEFCIGSQNNQDNNPDIYKKYIVQSEYGKMVLFDGRIIHRGLENKSNTTRYAIYISYYKKSYTDEEIDRLREYYIIGIHSVLVTNIYSSILFCHKKQVYLDELKNIIMKPTSSSSIIVLYFIYSTRLVIIS
jgi:ectoine hydroxylase-related dioxygenase (phytanoyl-CoA dioxygenase family)